MEMKSVLTQKQRQLLDFLETFVQEEGYSPTLEEMALGIGVRSVATVHKHLEALQSKGYVQRGKNQGRSTQPIMASQDEEMAVQLPMLGLIAAGQPILAVQQSETVAVPPQLVGRGECYVLRVTGDSMIEEHILDGDWVVVERRETARNGEVVVALIDGEEVTLKRFFHSTGRVQLVPANPDMHPIILPADRVRIQGVVVGVMRQFT
jgi:repressor LexA